MNITETKKVLNENGCEIGKIPALRGTHLDAKLDDIYMDFRHGQRSGNGRELQCVFVHTVFDAGKPAELAAAKKVSKMFPGVPVHPSRLGRCCDIEVIDGKLIDHRVKGAA